MARDDRAAYTDPRDPLTDRSGRPLTGRARERAAREAATDILRRAGKVGTRGGDEYGTGRLTKDQRKSQQRHIGWSDAPQTRGQKIRRSLFG